MRRALLLGIAFGLIGCTSDDSGPPAENPVDSGGAIDSTVPPGGHDASTSDGSRDAGADTTTPVDANVEDTNVADTNQPDTYDAGPLGTQTNPALSCKAILAALPGSTDGAYYVAATGNPADAFQTFCDMTTEGGGWTKVTASVPDAQVRMLLGASGRQMVKCSDATDGGAGWFASPSFVPLAPLVADGGADAGLDASADAGPDAEAEVVWSWDVHDFVQVPGTWRANGASVACSNNPEYTQFTNCAWWGVGCGDGPGGNNKFFPGVLDSPSAGFCADTTSGHTNGNLVVCGQTNYRTYSVFVRAD